MASFSFISDLLAATCRVVARGPGSLVVTVGGQTVTVTRLEIESLEWVRLAAPVGPEHLFAHREALRHGPRHPWGALVLDGTDYVLSQVLPLVGVEVAIVARVALALAGEAARLRREHGQAQNPFAGYAA